MFLKILDSIKSNLKQQNSEPTAQKGLALAILFVQLAKIDNDFSTEEHQLIIKILQERYSIDKTEARKMIQEAETVEQETSDTVQITKEIKGIIPYEERLEIIRDLWQIIMVDQERSNEENNFMRLIVKLLGVSDKLNAQIRMDVIKSNRDNANLDGKNS